VFYSLYTWEILNFDPYTLSLLHCTKDVIMHVEEDAVLASYANARNLEEVVAVCIAHTVYYCRH